MWLINTANGQLEEFMDERKTYRQYAILSHTWETEEVSFEDFNLPSSTNKLGFRKIQGAIDQARKDRIQYVWCDTCCIDKRSSAELSEAINSMYRWYYNSAVCYVYLSDLELPEGWLRSGGEVSEANLAQCRWFWRGWTLQELIAPHSVVFFESKWLMFGTKQQLCKLLSEITDIDEAILSNRERLQDASVANRMSFAANRATTRLEDQAYSLLGIFNVNMPLLYGEGQRAFIRLQEEIIRSWQRIDHSILVWLGERDGLLAKSPSQFPARFDPAKWGLRTSAKGPRRDIVSWTLPQDEIFELSNKGLRISLHIVPGRRARPHRLVPLPRRGADEASPSAMLNCCYRDSPGGRLGVLLERRPRIQVGRTSTSHRHSTEDYAIYDCQRLTTTGDRESSSLREKTLTIARTPYSTWPSGNRIWIDWRSDRFRVGSSWQGEHKGFMLHLRNSSLEMGRGVVRFSNSFGLEISSLPQEYEGSPPRGFYMGICRLDDPHYYRHTDMSQFFMDNEYVLKFEERKIISVATSYTIADGDITYSLTITDPSKADRISGYMQKAGRAWLKTISTRVRSSDSSGSVV